MLGLYIRKPLTNRFNLVKKSNSEEELISFRNKEYLGFIGKIEVLK